MIELEYSFLLRDASLPQGRACDISDLPTWLPNHTPKARPLFDIGIFLVHHGLDDL